MSTKVQRMLVCHYCELKGFNTHVPHVSVRQTKLGMKPQSRPLPNYIFLCVPDMLTEVTCFATFSLVLDEFQAHKQ